MKTQMAGPTPDGRGWGLRIHVVNKFSGDTEADGPDTLIELLT